MKLLLRPYVKHLYLVLFILFFANKFMIRPWLLAFDTPVLHVIVYSLPNFIEAIYGVFLITGIILYAKSRKTPIELHNIKIYITATVLAATFVITQELKIHNLGGRNVFDTNDLIASIIGLITAFAIIYKHGLLEAAK